MDDSQIHQTIEQLVAEEHELWQREAAGSASDDDRRRLQALKVSLDQCWDLLRQRRALRESRPARGRNKATGDLGWGSSSCRRSVAVPINPTSTRIAAPARLGRPQNG